MVSSGVWNGSELEAEFFGALLNWAERPTEQAVGHELVQPLEQRDPVALGQPLHAGGFHGDGVDPHRT